MDRSPPPPPADAEGRRALDPPPRAADGFRAVLLILCDGPWRRRVAAALRGAMPRLRCLESDDPVGAMLAYECAQFDLVVLDARLGERHGAALATNWRRLAPHARVLEYRQRSGAAPEALAAEIAGLLRPAPARPA